MTTPALAGMRSVMEAVIFDRGLSAMDLRTLLALSVRGGQDSQAWISPTTLALQLTGASRSRAVPKSIKRLVARRYIVPATRECSLTDQQLTGWSITVDLTHIRTLTDDRLSQVAPPEPKPSARDRARLRRASHNAATSEGATGGETGRAASWPTPWYWSPDQDASATSAEAPGLLDTPTPASALPAPTSTSADSAPAAPAAPDLLDDRAQVVEAVRVAQGGILHPKMTQQQLGEADQLLELRDPSVTRAAHRDELLEVIRLCGLDEWLRGQLSVKALLGRLTEISAEARSKAKRREKTQPPARDLVAEANAAAKVARADELYAERSRRAGLEQRAEQLAWSEGIPDRAERTKRAAAILSELLRADVAAAGPPA